MRLKSTAWHSRTVTVGSCSLAGIPSVLQAASTNQSRNTARDTGGLSRFAPHGTHAAKDIARACVATMTLIGARRPGRTGPRIFATRGRRPRRARRRRTTRTRSRLRSLRRRRRGEDATTTIVRRSRRGTAAIAFTKGRSSASRQGWRTQTTSRRSGAPTRSFDLKMCMFSYSVRGSYRRTTKVPYPT